MKLRPTSFSSKTTPYRVVLPARLFPGTGKRKTKYFAFKQDALAFCKNVNDHGIAALLDHAPIPKTEHDQMETAIRWALNELGGDFTRLYDAIDHFKLTRLNIKRATVREAFEAYDNFRKNAGMAPRTVRSDSGSIRKLMLTYEQTHISELTSVQLREFFDSISRGSVRSVYKRVKKFFSWCHQRGYLGENPMATIEPQGEFGVNNEYYPVETFRRMLSIVAGLEPARISEEPTRDFIDLLPVFVLGGFAGLRPCETCRNERGEAMRWTDLYFDGVDHPNIEIRHEVAKKTKRKSGLRPVDMPAALEAVEAWLQLMPRDHSEFIVRWGARKIQDLKTKFRKRTGIKFLENGFRNSFATYALAYSTLSGLGHVAKQMGNSEAICREHYAQNLPTGSGRAWFNLRPFEVVSLAAATA